MSIKNISVIGLGLMGTPIVTLLIKAGYSVTGFDIAEKQMSNLVPLGMKPTTSPKEASKGADLILLSLPNWPIIREVVEGKEGIGKGPDRVRSLLIRVPCHPGKRQPWQKG